MSKGVKTIWYVAAALAALAAVNFVYPFVWVLTPVSGRVIDRATGSPIANAAVAVSWSLQSWEGNVVAYLYLGETTTDEKGEFHLAVRGPKFHFPQGRIKRTQPEIRVIADGYLPIEARSSNDVTSAFLYAGAKQNDQSFRLDAAIPGEDFERAVENFINYFPFVRENHHCEWLRVPQTMNRVVHAREGLVTVGRGAGLPASAPPPRAKCI
jgi:hypothetical protein